MNFLRDLRFGFRILARNPTFGAAAIVVVALGIGATTSVFSVVRGVLLQPLPYREPERLVLFRADGPGVSRQALVTGYELAAIRERSDLFESIAVINESPGNLTTPDQMEAVTAASPSDNFLDTLGLRPFLGRMVSIQDLGPKWVTAVDISYELWQRRWQSDPNIVGKPIEVNNIPMTIAGVLPPRFMLELGPNVPIRRLDIWFPRGPGYDEGPTRSQTVIARLRPGISLQQAQAGMNAMTAAIVAANPAGYYVADASADTRFALFVLGVFALLATVLTAIGVYGVAAYATARRTREIAVRLALGADARRIVALVLREGWMWTVAGLAAGVVGALLLSQYLRALLFAVDARDPLTFAGVALLLGVIALIASVVPAINAIRVDPMLALRSE